VVDILRGENSLDKRIKKEWISVV